MADFVKYAQLFPGLRRTHRPLDFRGESHEAAIIMCPFHTKKKEQEAERPSNTTRRARRRTEPRTRVS